MSSHCVLISHRHDYGPVGTDTNCISELQENGSVQLQGRQKCF